MHIIREPAPPLCGDFIHFKDLQPHARDGEVILWARTLGAIDAPTVLPAGSTVPGSLWWPVQRTWVRPC